MGLRLVNAGILLQKKTSCIKETGFLYIGITLHTIAKDVKKHLPLLIMRTLQITELYEVELQLNPEIIGV